MNVPPDSLGLPDCPVGAWPDLIPAGQTKTLIAHLTPRAPGGCFRVRLPQIALWGPG